MVVTADFDVSIQSRVEAARAAFLSDTAYAASMARAAVVIATKRRASHVRKVLRAAETAAHDECRRTDPFPCHAVSPCGVGDCKFAKGQLAGLVIQPAPGSSLRPQAINTGG